MIIRNKMIKNKLNLKYLLINNRLLINSQRKYIHHLESKDIIKRDIENNNRLLEPFLFNNNNLTKRLDLLEVVEMYQHTIKREE